MFLHLKVRVSIHFAARGSVADTHQLQVKYRTYSISSRINKYFYLGKCAVSRKSKYFPGGLPETAMIARGRGAKLLNPLWFGAVHPGEAELVDFAGRGC
jgi:hypothetical protein